MHCWPRCVLVLGLLLLGALGPACAQTTVKIEVQPHKLNVRPQAQGKLTICFVCSPAFNPVLIDQKTLAAGPGGATAENCELKDEDEDGCAELICRVDRPSLGITCADTELTVTATLTDGTAIVGKDRIQPIPCKK